MFWKLFRPLGRCNICSVQLRLWLWRTTGTTETVRLVLLRLYVWYYWDCTSGTTGTVCLDVLLILQVWMCYWYCRTGFTTGTASLDVLQVLYVWMYSWYLDRWDAPAGWNINAVHTQVGEDGAVVLRGELLLLADGPLLHLLPVLLVLPVRP